jgi:hypothetical protein
MLSNHHTERSCTWTTLITTVSQSSSSINSSQSHRSTSLSPHLLRPNPAEGEWLASHSCEAGLSQCHTHIARYHTTTCQQLPSPQREYVPQHHAAQPLSTGWVHTRHSGLDDIAAACISRVATAACGEGGGASEGRAHSVEVQTKQHHHPIPHLEACSYGQAFTDDGGAVRMCACHGWRTERRFANPTLPR